MIIGLIAAAFTFVQAEAPRTISWADLVPEGDQVASAATPQSHDGGPGMQTGSAEAVMELDGQLIRMPGFMLPLDYTERGKVRGFLLVPYYGACIHVPPPPPNQIVFVDSSADPVDSKGLWDPVWVTGTMTVKMNENDLGDAAYTLTLQGMEPYTE